MAGTYSEGTVSVENGERIVRLNTAGDPAWLPGVVADGDDFVCGGQLYVIDTVDGWVDDQYQLTLTNDYAGSTEAEAAYTIRQVSPVRKTARQIDAGLAELIARIGSNADLLSRILTASANLAALDDLDGQPNHLIGFSGPGGMMQISLTDLLTGVLARVDGPDDLDQLDDAPEGFSVFVGDIGDGRAALYWKLSDDTADWSEPAYWTGGKGDAGGPGPYTEISVGSVTTVPHGTPATIVPTVVAPGEVELDFEIPAGKDGNDGTGTGDMVGPGSAEDGHAVVFDGSTGKLVKSLGKAPLAVDASNAGDINAQTAFRTNIAAQRISRALNTAGTDWNDIVQPGWHGWLLGTSNANAPMAGQYYYALVIGYIDAQNLIQLAFPYRVSGGGAFWWRVRAAGTWGAWYRSYDASNILGTVSQAGGVPTGAIIERGSNANGEYVRFADGTQICTHRATNNVAISTAALGGFRSGGQGWTYPAAFAVAPKCVSNVAELTALAGITYPAIATPLTSATYFFVAVTSQGAIDRIVDLVAIGRWF